MNQSPISLNDYHLLDISIKHEEGYVSVGSDTYPDITDTVFTSTTSIGIPDGEDDPKDFLLGLNLKIEPKKADAYPYSVDISVQGYVTVLSDLPGENFDRQEFALINGSSLLYGALRDTLLMLTSRCVHGAIMLPTVNFLDLKNGSKNVSKNVSKKKVSVRKSKK
ncbi:MAG: hypothetical protein OEY89_13400 [Gammaproteobacteria bacterium]|nr:hypothetical protein [Gammaproteobacteria bacterium]